MITKAGRRLRAGLRHGFEDIESGRAGHLVVDEVDVEVLVARDLDRFLAAPGRHHRVAERAAPCPGRPRWRVRRRGRGRLLAGAGSGGPAAQRRSGSHGQIRS